MPLYEYRGTDGKVIEVLREFNDYQIPPTREELEKEGLDPDQVYERIISKGIRTIWSPGWGNGKMGSGKGTWVIPLLIIGDYLCRNIF